LVNKDPANSHAVTWTGAGAPTGNVTVTCLGTCTNALTDNNSTVLVGGTPAVTVPVPTTLTNPTSYTVCAGCLVTMTYGTGTSQVATPVFSPDESSFYGSVTVTIADSTAGSTIYYTTNGTNPSASSAEYTGPLTFTVSTNLKAIGVAAGLTNSAIAENKYDLLTQAATPTFSPAAGTYSTAQTVTISDATPNATIYYTTNGTTPTTSSTVYTGAITVQSTTTVKAIAVASGVTNSSVGSATYTIN